MERTLLGPGRSWAAERKAAKETGEEYEVWTPEVQRQFSTGVAEGAAARQKQLGVDGHGFYSVGHESGVDPEPGDVTSRQEVNVLGQRTAVPMKRGHCVGRWRVQSSSSQ